MRHPRLAGLLAGGLLAGPLLAAGVATTPAALAAAPKAPAKPCGTYALRATHAASADYFDHNGNRLECWRNPAPPSTDPNPEYGKDDLGLPLSKGYKFYDWGDSATGVTSVNARRNRFTAFVKTQEDDRDMNGCYDVCFERLRYDANDLFYIDFGNGSRKVPLSRFEANLRGSELFTMIYEPPSRRLSVFSLELG